MSKDGLVDLKLLTILLFYFTNKGTSKLTVEKLISYVKIKSREEPKGEMEHKHLDLHFYGTDFYIQ